MRSLEILTVLTINAEFGDSNTELIELLSEHEPDIIVILNAFI